MTKSKRFILLIQAALFSLLFVGLQLRGGNTPSLNVYLSGTLKSFSFLDEQGRLEGFNVDVIRAVCEKIDRECVFTVKSFKEIMSGVERGQADLGAANFLKTPERAALFDFSIPYWRSTSSYIGSGSLMSEGKVCAIAQTAQWKYLKSKKPESIYESASQQSQFDSLIQGKCNQALLPTLQALEFLQTPEGQGFHYVGEPLREAGLGGDVHFILKKGDAKLNAEINQALGELVKDGSLERIMLQYFPFSIR
jgi:ABC-type amino acid transport substrate-binding protein